MFVIYLLVIINWLLSIFVLFAAMTWGAFCYILLLFLLLFLALFSCLFSWWILVLLLGSLLSHFSLFFCLGFFLSSFQFFLSIFRFWCLFFVVKFSQKVVKTTNKLWGIKTQGVFNFRLLDFGLLLFLLFFILISFVFFSSLSLSVPLSICLPAYSFLSKTRLKVVNCMHSLTAWLTDWLTVCIDGLGQAPSTKTTTKFQISGLSCFRWICLRLKPLFCVFYCLLFLSFVFFSKTMLATS